jgi:Predicted integral membrane protein
MPLSAHPFDMYVWYNDSKSILANGPLYLEGFPPLWYHYLMIPVAYLYSGLSQILPSGTIPMASLPSALDYYPAYNISVVPGMLFNFIVKIPFLISDTLIALLLYKIVGEFTGKKALAQSAALLWFLNPFVIWISASWGMWDTLPALFSLAAMYLLIKRRFALSAVSLSLGVAAKLYPAIFLVPLIFYLYKTSDPVDRKRNLGMFIGVFFGASLLLFLPYLGTAANFVADFFLLGSGSTVHTIIPIGPFSFGVTYWSLTAYLNLDSGGILFVSVASLVLFVAALMLVYWRSSKFTFKSPVSDLSMAMLFCTAALLLSYRIVCEQWIIWAIPFLVLLCAEGRMRKTVFAGLSAFALIYAMLNCPLPFFFLPLTPGATNTLLGMVYFIWWQESTRVWVLAISACAFSLLLFLSVVRLSLESLKNEKNAKSPK